MLKKEGLSLIEIKRILEKGKMSETGRRRSEGKGTDGLDFLAERVAEVVKMEVLRFLQRGKG